mmetsp:Transcript_5216/g.17091  ORF Transcript_5216/g.17091 Transcript_5216/m.17091 type:complete len:222 (+) Transcript_5216:263-928(+)
MLLIRRRRRRVVVVVVTIGVVGGVDVEVDLVRGAGEGGDGENLRVGLQEVLFLEEDGFADPVRRVEEDEDEGRRDGVLDGDGIDRAQEGPARRRVHEALVAAVEVAAVEFEEERVDQFHDARGGPLDVAQSRVGVAVVVRPRGSFVQRDDATPGLREVLREGVGAVARRVVQHDRLRVFREADALLDEILEMPLRPPAEVRQVRSDAERERPDEGEHGSDK